MGLLVFFLTANYTQAQITFGTRVGFNYTNFYCKVDGERPDKEDRPKFISGIQIGVIADYVLNDAVSVQPGFLFSTHGAKEEQFSYFMPKMVLVLYYLQIPVNLQYKLDVGGMKLLLQAGPYLGYAISGKGKFWDRDGKRISDKDLNDAGITPKLKFGSKETELKPLDFGIGLGAGLQFGNLQIGLGYNFGLVDIHNHADISNKNNSFVATATFLFGKTNQITLNINN